jgi:hypothetical protein
MTPMQHQPPGTAKTVQTEGWPVPRLGNESLIHLNDSRIRRRHARA